MKVRLLGMQKRFITSDLRRIDHHTWRENQSAWKRPKQKIQPGCLLPFLREAGEEIEKLKAGHRPNEHFHKTANVSRKTAATWAAVPRSRGPPAWKDVSISLQPLPRDEHSRSAPTCLCDGPIKVMLSGLMWSPHYAAKWDKITAKWGFLCVSHTNCTLGSKASWLQPSVPVGCQLNLQLQHGEHWLEHWEPAAATNLCSSCSIKSVFQHVKL